jgi:galactonate dehydratase
MALGIVGATAAEQAESARKARDGGYTAIKFTPMPRQWQLQPYAVMIKDAIERVEAVREAVGWEVDVGLEIHRNMQPAEALVFCDEVARFRPYFIEDPLVPDSVVAMGDLAGKVRLPLAVGERNQGPYEFREYAQLTNCAFFKPDVAVAGGITGLRKIAAIAEAGHTRIAPHNFQGPIATAACIQLGIAMPAWDVQEVADESSGARRAMVKAPVEIRDGYFIPPQAVGLGVEFDEAAAPRYPYEAPSIPPEIREDGSVALR